MKIAELKETRELAGVLGFKTTLEKGAVVLLGGQSAENNLIFASHTKTGWGYVPQHVIEPVSGDALYIDWLGDCPKCGFHAAYVISESKAVNWLNAGDDVHCANCETKGEIELYESELVSVAWDYDPERMEQEERKLSFEAKPKQKEAAIQFVREDRYLVLKRKDIDAALNWNQKAQLLYLSKLVEADRLYRGKEHLECVVVEHDWPNYSEVWASVESVANGSYKKADATSEQDALIQRMFDAGLFGALGYDELMETLLKKGVIDELYYCECDNCGSCFDVVKVGSICDNCNIGTMQPQDVEPWGEE